MLKEALEGPISSLQEIVLCQQWLSLDRTALMWGPANTSASPVWCQCTPKVTQRGVGAGSLDLESSIKSNTKKNQTFSPVSLAIYNSL